MNVDCPICGGSFPQDGIEDHVNRCLEGGQELPPDPLLVENEENERLFRQFLAQEEAEAKKREMMSVEPEMKCSLCNATGISKMFFFDV